MSKYNITKAHLVGDEELLNKVKQEEVKLLLKNESSYIYNMKYSSDMLAYILTKLKNNKGIIRETNYIGKKFNDLDHSSKFEKTIKYVNNKIATCLLGGGKDYPMNTSISLNIERLIADDIVIQSNKNIIDAKYTISTLSRQKINNFNFKKVDINLENIKSEWYTTRFVINGKAVYDYLLSLKDTDIKLIKNIITNSYVNCPIRYIDTKFIKYLSFPILIHIYQELRNTNILEYLHGYDELIYNNREHYDSNNDGITYNIISFMDFIKQINKSKAGTEKKIRLNSYGIDITEDAEDVNYFIEKP